MHSGCWLVLDALIVFLSVEVEEDAAVCHGFSELVRPLRAGGIHLAVLVHLGVKISGKVRKQTNK